MLSASNQYNNMWPADERETEVRENYLVRRRPSNHTRFRSLCRFQELT